MDSAENSRRQRFTMNDPTDPGVTRRDFIKAGVLAGAASLPVVALADALGPPGPPSAVDLLILGPDVVTFDDKDTVIMDGAIAVKGNAIVWIGKASEAAGEFTPKETLKASGQIAMPGMTDTHYHTAQQFLRGVHRTTHRKGPSWKKILIPFESGLAPVDVYHSGMVGY